MLSKFTKIFIAIACLIFIGLFIQAAREGKEINTVIPDVENRRHVEEAKKAIKAGRMAEAKQHLVAMDKSSQEWNSEGKVLWDRIGSFIIQERQKEINTRIPDVESRRHVEEAKKAIKAGRMAEAKQHLVAMNKFSREWNSEGKVLWDRIESFVIQERHKKEKNRLKQLIKATTFHGQRFIESYSIESGSAYLQINASLWNTLSSEQQRQICDMLASTDVWKTMGLLNAHLYVYRTYVGRIGPNWSGGYEFKPELKSLE